MKWNKSMWIATAIMVPIIAIVCILSVNNAKEYDAVSVIFMGKAELRNTIEIPLSQAKELAVEYSSKNLQVYPAEGDTIVIKEYLLSDKEEAKARCVTEGERATVTGGNVSTIIMFGGIGERIEIYLPKEGLHSVELKTSSGNITANETFALTAGKVSVAAKSGNIRWRDTKAEAVSLTASSGNVKCRSLEATEILVSTNSGNIDAEDVSGKLEISASSGNINALQIEGCGSMSANSGNVKVEADAVTGDMHLKTSSGNIKLLVPKELSFGLEIQTGSGNISTDFDDYLSYNKKGNQASGVVGAAADCQIAAQAGSGNVKITRNE